MQRKISHLEEADFLARGWKMSFLLHAVIGLVGTLGISSRLSTPSAEVLSVGIAFVDAVADSPAPAGTSEGTIGGTLLKTVQEAPSAEETTEESAPSSTIPESSPAAPATSNPPTLTTTEAAAEMKSSSAPEPLPKASPESSPKPSPEPVPEPVKAANSPTSTTTEAASEVKTSSAPEPLPKVSSESSPKPVPEPAKSISELVKSVSEPAPNKSPEPPLLQEGQKAPPQQEKTPELQRSSAKPTKLDTLMEEETSSQEDFLHVLKDIDATKKKGPARAASSSQIAGNGKEKVRKGIARGAIEGVLTLGEEDFIRQQIYPHWSISGGVAEAENLIVELRIMLQDDGTVTNIQILDEKHCQEDPRYRAAAESARRAVRIASPLKIPPNRLELLRSFRLRFNPKDALR